MKIARFDPPGGLADLSAKGLKDWSSFISDTVDRSIAGRTDHPNDSPRGQIYNLTKTDTADDAIFQEVSWTAFPKALKVNAVSDARRWRRADSSRDLQDEYCEWSVSRRADGKITRVTFTSEAPEYWEVLARTSPDALVKLYQQFVNPAVKKADLFDSSKRYIRKNRWNSTTTNGAMHLVQDANTLSAEIELAAAASIVRKIRSKVLTGDQELIKCSQYGEPLRNSDPHIGGVVNSVARLKADLAVANPVGLYLKDLATDGWASPDGTDPKSFWKIVRGQPETAVRAVYEVPAAKGYTVGDITIAGKPIAFGAQIADFITVKLTAVACRVGKSTVKPMTACVGAAGGPEAANLFALEADPDAGGGLGIVSTR